MFRTMMKQKTRARHSAVTSRDLWCIIQHHYKSEANEVHPYSPDGRKFKFSGPNQMKSITLPRLGNRELICLLLFTCNYVASVWRGFLFLWVLGMGYVILLWHSLSLPYNYFLCRGPHRVRRPTHRRAFNEVSKGVNKLIIKPKDCRITLKH